MTAPLLDVSDLTKAFGGRIAVDHVTFQIAAGEAVGLLGPNGAGKTTTLSMIAGLVRPDSGDVRIAGHLLQADTDPAKGQLGLVPQDLALYEELSGNENLEFFGGLQGLRRAALQERIRYALDFVGLADRAKDPVKTYSGGMKRRLNLAVALLHDPQLLLLDEPTVGVDPQSRNALFENIESLQRCGKAILYTTHYMEEVERLCDRIVIMDHGRMIANDTLAGLQRRQTRRGEILLEIVHGENLGWIDPLRTLPGIQGAKLDAGRLVLEVSSLSEGVSEALDHLRREGIEVLTVASHQPRLEDVFLEMTGRSLRDS